MIKSINLRKNIVLGLITITCISGTVATSLAQEALQPEVNTDSAAAATGDCEEKSSNVCLQVKTIVGTITKKGILRIRL